jgi:hypothetical protein
MIPIDPGGRTNQGIIQREFSAWRRKQGLPNQDVFLMSNAEGDQIYWENYGAKIFFDQLPPGINIVLLDGAINSGVSQSVKWMQRCLGVSATGIMGNITLQAILQYPDHDDLIKKMDRQAKRVPSQPEDLLSLRQGLDRQDLSSREDRSGVGDGQCWPGCRVDPEHEQEGHDRGRDSAGLDGTCRHDHGWRRGLDHAVNGAEHAVSLFRASSRLRRSGAHRNHRHRVHLPPLAEFSWAWYARRKNTALNDALDLTPVHAANDNDICPRGGEIAVRRSDCIWLARPATSRRAMSSTSGRTAGDTEVRVNEPSPVPKEKAA